MPRSLSAVSMPTLVLLLLLGTAGCYEFVSQRPEAAAPVSGAPVRVHLSEPSSFDVSGFTAHQIERLDGSLMERTDDSWVIGTLRMHAVDGGLFEAGSWALTVPADQVETVDVRQFSWLRSAVAGAIGVAVIGVAISAIQGVSNSDGGTTEDGGGQRSVIPVGIRIPVP